jgi:hypothetical protein
VPAEFPGREKRQNVAGRKTVLGKKNGAGKKARKKPWKRQASKSVT